MKRREEVGIWEGKHPWSGKELVEGRDLLPPPGGLWPGRPNAWLGKSPVDELGEKQGCLRFDALWPDLALNVFQRIPVSHKVIEKRRRDRINRCLHELGKTVPMALAKQVGGSSQASGSCLWAKGGDRWDLPGIKLLLNS